MTKKISDAQLKEYRKSDKVNRAVANRLLHPVENKPVIKQVDAIESLVVSVSDAVQSAGQMNQQALNLIQQMFNSLSLIQPIIPAPRVYLPDPPKRWRFTVKRDSDGLIAEVVAERLDDLMPAE